MRSFGLIVEGNFEIMLKVEAKTLNPSAEKKNTIFSALSHISTTKVFPLEHAYIKELSYAQGVSLVAISELGHRKGLAISELGHIKFSQHSSVYPCADMVMEQGRARLSALYQNSRKSLMKMGDELARLDPMKSSFYMAHGLDSPEVLSIKRDITQIQSNCVEMDRIWSSLASEPQQNIWKRKVERVATEVDLLKEVLDRDLVRAQKCVLAAKARAELLQKDEGNPSRVLRIPDDEQAMQPAHNASIMLEQAYSTGVAFLSNYADQRIHMKRAQRKALDLLNTLGLSNAVLNLIHRRHRVDKWIAFASMSVTIIFVYALWKWT